MISEPAQIKILPEAVVEKIAAGEVIERPYSVLKELVENALDAQADRIDITIENGGFSLIKVVDNGVGMTPDNLQRSVLRHATSKISAADDLFAIATLGFRGEALASVAAVSRFSIISSASGDGLGYELQCVGGAVKGMKPHPHTRGATIACRDLFFNVPARKKFMKSAKAERLAMVRMIEQLALPYPAVHFTVTVDGKKTLDTPQCESAIARIAQIAGVEFSKNLIPCSLEREGLAATIYITTPDHATPRPRFQCLFVNLRRVDCDPVTYGIREAFSRFITSHFRPAWFCFLDIDPDKIDVNVHPTKQKIRFDEERRLFGFVFETVKQGVAAHMSSGLERESRPLVSQSDASGSIVAFPSPEPRPCGVSEESGAKNYALDPPPKASARPAADAQTSLRFFSLADQFEKKAVEGEGQSTVQLSDERWDLIPCYQIHRTYILAPIKKGVLIIDQHAAHERILFEQAIEDLTRGKTESQRMLFPVVLEFSAAEKSVIIAGRGYFTALGYDIQDFGGNSIAVSATPAAGVVSQPNIEEAVREMVEYLLEEKNREFLSEPQKRFAAAFACGSALKAGQALKQEEMNALLNNLFAAANPYTCPHGRPTLVRISMDELSRRFLR